MDELLERDIDHLIFSGDATALGFESEFRYTAQALRIGQYPIPGLAVPGNHDYCTPSAEASGAFERCFTPWQEGQRIDGHRYPFAQKAGAIWLVGVNAATGNRWPTDAGGTVGPHQLERLRRLLASLEPSLKILVVHYPLCLSNGLPETKQHALRDVDALLDVANRGGVNLWLHGHRHTPYYLPRPAGAAFPVICAGSATQRHLWSYGEYTIEGTHLQALRRTYDTDAKRFRDAETFSLNLQ
jgi:3',5'-cyclic AMP phosphodiesterase CpdA